MSGNEAQFTKAPRDRADLSVQHLVAELARLDLRLQRAVRCWQLAGQAPDDAFRGQYTTDAEARALVARPFGSNWGHSVALPPTEERAYLRAMEQATQHVQAIAAQARQRDEVLRLEHLSRTFDLSPLEVDVLLIALAPALDLRYERIYGYLQDDVTRRRPSVDLALTLLCPPGAERLPCLTIFSDTSPLFRHHLLTYGEDASAPLLRRMLTIDESVVAWLLGTYHPHPALRERIHLLHPPNDGTHRLLLGDLQAELARLTTFDPPPLIILHGPDRARQMAAAGQIAAQYHRPLLHADLTAGSDNGHAPLDALRLALRDARMTEAIPYLTGLVDGGATDSIPPSALLRELLTYPGPIVLSLPEAGRIEGLERDRHCFWVHCAVPSYEQRLSLWQHFMRRRHIVPPPQRHLQHLAGQFALTGGQIRDAVNTAYDLAAQVGRPVSEEHLFAAARRHSSSKLAELAVKITPRYTWDDIILPEDQLAMLREITQTVLGRPLVLHRWGLGRKLVPSEGITVLFSGPPGTGKTMAAGILAKELGLDLYKIDLSLTVSKYIGETEKNLARIFREAEHSNAILFFDEADALFGKRSEVRDAHDRYANIEISYLLQQMEAYNGLTILATNLQANLDEAFTRRLHFSVVFPFPEEEYRLRIWQTLFPPDVPRAPDVDFELLARHFKLAGGNIRNIIVAAAYLAAAEGEPVSMRHLLHGVRREFQKMGRLVPEMNHLLKG